MVVIIISNFHLDMLLYQAMLVCNSCYRCEPTLLDYLVVSQIQTKSPGLLYMVIKYPRQYKGKFIKYMYFQT